MDIPVSEHSSSMMEQNQFVQIVTPNGQPIVGPQYGQQPTQILMTPQGQMLMTQPPPQPQQKIIVVKTEDGEQQYIIQEPMPQPQYVIKQSAQQPYVVMNQGGGNQQGGGGPFITSSAPVISNNSSSSGRNKVGPGTSPGAGSGKKRGAGGGSSNIPNKKQHQRESSGMSILSEVASRELGGSNQTSSPAPRKQVKSKNRNNNNNNSMNNNNGPNSNSGPPPPPSNQFMMSDPPPGPPPSGPPQAVHTQLPQLTNRHPSGENNDIKPYIDEFGQVRIPGTKSTVEKNKDKRERNKLAARRCRQRKMDKIKTLEETVSRMNGVLTNLRHTLTNVKRFATDNGLKELQNIISGIDLNDKMLQPFDLRRLDEELMSDRHALEVKQEPIPIQQHFHQSNITEQVRLNMQATANRQMQLANQEQQKTQMIAHETHIINGQPFVTAVTTSINNSGMPQHAQHHEILQQPQMQAPPQNIRVQQQQQIHQNNNNSLPKLSPPKNNNNSTNNQNAQTPQRQISVKTESTTPEKANNSELPSSEAERETSMLDKALADSQKSPEISMNDIEGLITATPEADSRNQSLDKILEETSSEPVKPELMEAALDEASASSLNTETPVDKIEKSPETATTTTKVTEKQDKEDKTSPSSTSKTSNTSSEKVEKENNKNSDSKQNDEKSSSGDKNVAADITKELANATQKSKPAEK